ncbi:MAG: hypothetical protein IJU81_02330 [Bacteroidales bacterium]|nr:hypothetical protein [Bacteroidales bacterium]
MRHTAIIIILLTICCAAFGQSLSLTFTSVTEARFHVYLNGVLQNEQSRQEVTINGLRSRKYHIRIVMDDPYQVAVTKSIKPSGRNNKYSVKFNPVRERIIVRRYKDIAQNEKNRTNSSNSFIAVNGGSRLHRS